MGGNPHLCPASALMHISPSNFPQQKILPSPLSPSCCWGSCQCPKHMSMLQPASDALKDDERTVRDWSWKQDEELLNVNRSLRLSAWFIFSVARARSIHFTLALCIAHGTTADNHGMTALLSSTRKQLVVMMFITHSIGYFTIWSHLEKDN